jgi:nitroreductase
LSTPLDPAPSSPVIALQHRHRSVRRYTGEPIPRALLEGLIRAGQHAASSSFIQAYSVVRVTDPEARAAISAAAGNQTWIERAAEFLVFCADLRRVNAACLREGTGDLEGWTEHGLAAVVDVALLAQNVLLAAESVGLGGVFIGGIRNDPVRVSEILALPELVAPIFGMCLGWPAENPEVKPRQPLGLVLHQDRYRDPEPEEVQAYDHIMAAYYGGRGSNTRASDWSATTAKAVQGKKREHLLGFLRGRGFFRM